MNSKDWDVTTTDFGRLTVNPIRKLTERERVTPNPDKEVITLQVGDPTVFGNFPPPKECIDAIKKAFDVDNFSYDPSAGMLASRQAVAEYCAHQGNVTADDVILTSGCSMALEICFRALAQEGENILIPRPCWNYTTWILGSKIEARLYNLDPSKDWEIDVKHLESLIDGNTKAILINSPGNPCGNVLSVQNILDVLELAERHRIPIIADEVYEFFVFPGVEYQSISSLSKNVPVLSCSGLTKRFLVPGIRMGWIVINDRNNILKDVRQGLVNISGRNFGPNGTVQLALPDILKNISKSFFDDAMDRIANQANTAYEIFKSVPGLKPIMPKGTIYMMIGIDLGKFPKYSTCLEFAEDLIRDQSVLVFPGYPFNFPGYFRIVLTIPEEMLITACNRIKELCGKEYAN
ncbi:unnamed protein product [Diamesa hyperborea]